jgi:hypothetical protein
MTEDLVSMSLIELIHLKQQNRINCVSFVPVGTNMNINHQMIKGEKKATFYIESILDDMIKSTTSIKIMLSIENAPTSSRVLLSESQIKLLIIPETTGRSSFSL